MSGEEVFGSIGADAGAHPVTHTSGHAEDEWETALKGSSGYEELPRASEQDADRHKSNTVYHGNNNESFSRSRASVGGMSDVGLESYAIHGPADDWQTETDRPEPPEVYAHDAKADFDAAFGDHSVTEEMSQEHEDDASAEPPRAGTVETPADALNSWAETIQTEDQAVFNIDRPSSNAGNPQDTTAAPESSEQAAANHTVPLSAPQLQDMEVMMTSMDGQPSSETVEELEAPLIHSDAQDTHDDVRLPDVALFREAMHDVSQDLDGPPGSPLPQSEETASVQIESTGATKISNSEMQDPFQGADATSFAQDDAGDISWLGGANESAPPEELAHAEQMTSELSMEDAELNTNAAGMADEWSKALAGSENGIEDSWNAALGDDFDDGGFLDEDGFLDDTDVAAYAQPENPNKQAANHLPSNQPAPVVSPRSSSMQYPASAYSQPYAPPAAPIVPATTSISGGDQATSSAIRGHGSGSGSGMKFFEDLPIAQPVRAKARPKQTTLANVPQPGPPPPPPGAARPPPGQKAPPQAQYTPGGLRRQQQQLEMFPAQPTVDPSRPPFGATPSESEVQLPQPEVRSQQPIEATPSAASSRYSMLQPPVPQQRAPSNSRYSPAPHQSSSVVASSARYAVSPNKPPAAPVPVANAQPNLSSLPPSITEPGPPPSKSNNTRYSPTPNVLVPPQKTTRAQPASKSVTPEATINNSETTADYPYAGHTAAAAANRYAPRTQSPLRMDARPSLDRSATQPDSRASPHGMTELSSPQSRSVAGATVPPPPPPKGSSTGPARRNYELPQRPHTQSPEAGRVISPGSEGKSLPAPVYTSDVTSQMSGHGFLQPQGQFHTHGPSAPDNYNFVEPVDPEQLSDPLQRWKGAPLVYWNSCGIIPRHFPLRAPRYGGGQAAPTIKSSAGEIRLQKSKELMPADELLVSFPGPLKSKSKKKELLLWLSNRIEVLQRDQSNLNAATFGPRAAERLMLWRLMRLLVEHDGSLTGNATVATAVRQLLTSGDIADARTPSRSATDASNLPTGGQADASNPAAVSEIRQCLATGNREKAAWTAVDNRLWGHAMLIASTLTDGVLWKQVALEFVRKEVRGTDIDAKPLSALYAVFAHDWNDSMDELVPLSARAGFQMVARGEKPSQSTDALEGLNRWQETLGLILANRSTDDENAILTLGNLLKSYGRVEAAHVCYLFARSTAKFGGADDTETHFTLVGADVWRDTPNDLDAILLSEVYEFSSLLATGSLNYLPHLQAYKLHHASSLAEHGMRSEAQQYCEAIGTAMKATTRPSQHYHGMLVMQLDDLNRRLSQAPKDGSSWISKPSIGKVSGSMWAKFNNFVAGDDADAASTGSGVQSDGDATGPLSRLPAGTPTISRSGSHADLASGDYGASIPPPSVNMNSRYAPSYFAQSGLSTNSSPGPQYPAATSPRDIPRPSGDAYAPFQPSSLGASSNAADLHAPPFHGLGMSDTASVGSAPFDPPHLEPANARNIPGYDSPILSDRGLSSRGNLSNMSLEDESGLSMPGPKHNNSYVPAMNGIVENGSPFAPQFQPHSTRQIETVENNSFDNFGGGGGGGGGGGYEPPAIGGSSYVPYDSGEKSATQEDSNPTPKKKQFGDDDEEDDELARRAAAARDAARAQKDRDADDLVRQLAEQDAQRDKEQKERKAAGGWFGGWFGGGSGGSGGLGGKNEPGEKKFHKAHEGEKLQMRWSAKKNRWLKPGESEDDVETKTATPPPPKAKGPPGGSRIPSATGTPDSIAGPPPMGGARGATPARPASAARSTGSDASGAGPPPPAPAGISNLNQPERGGDSGPPSRTPSRPATSMSDANNIDDLLGPAGARKAGSGGTVKKGKKGRYVDVMAK